jgi:hypothetical protein
MSDSNYLTFVESQTTGSPNGPIWWLDNTWLHQIKFQMPETAFNQFMKATKKENEKPEEFNSNCDGLKAMADRSRIDHKERVGYITQDGKFLITGIGNPETVDINVKKGFNQLFYYYKAVKGMPSLNYFGIYVDNETQEVMIPVRATVHIHTNGGISIDYPNSFSQQDLDFAQLVWDISSNKNYVIEVFGSTYKTGKFDDDLINNTSNSYLETHSGLTLSDICTFIN